MEEKTYYNNGWGSWGIAIFLIILFFFVILFLGRKETNDRHFDGNKAVCAAEKQEIIDSARTQYLIENTSRQTQEQTAAGFAALGTKIDFYEYQNLRDKVNEKDRQIMELNNKLFVKGQLEPVNAALASIQCNMLRRPDVTGVGVCCPNAAILNGLGVNSLNNCGCNGLV